MPKLHDPCRSSDLSSSCAVSLGQATHRPSLCLIFLPCKPRVTVLWVGQNGTGSGNALWEALRSSRLRDGLLPRQVGRTRPHSGVPPRLQALRAHAPRRGHPGAHPAGCSDRGAHHGGAVMGTLACRGRVPKYLHSPRAPKDNRARKMSFMSGVLTPANEGFATCACSAPLYPALGDLTGFAPPCGLKVPLRPPPFTHA